MLENIAGIIRMSDDFSFEKLLNIKIKIIEYYKNNFIQ